MPPEEDTTLELRDYLRVLRRHKWIILFSVLICIGGAFAMSLTKEPTYAASTKVWLKERFVDEQFIPTQQGDTQDSERERNNEIQIMGSPAVRQRVVDKLGRQPEDANFSAVENSDFIDISVVGDKPKRAAATANAYAETYIDVRKELAVTELTDVSTELQARIQRLNEQIVLIDLSFQTEPASPPTSTGRPTDQREFDRQRLESQVNSYIARDIDLQNAIALAQQGSAQIVTPATPPTAAQNRNPISNILAGAAIGLVIGIGLAFLREYLDDRIKTKDDLETASGQTVIGLIPMLSDWKNRDAVQLVSVAQPRSPAAEAYRSVRTSVEFLALDQPIGSLQVTSAMAGEGKTTTLANLAVAFARVGQRVIVLCCDLRRPRIHEFFGLSNRIGFTSMLLGDAPASEAIQKVRGDLPIGLVASGPLAPNPAELLASKRAVSVIEELDRQCDLLIIDSPPVLPVTDAQVISGLVDGVILVASSSSSNKRDVRRAVELLHQVDAPFIGAILNNVQSRHEAVYAYGDTRYYVDAPDPADSSPERRNGRRRKKAPAGTTG